MWVSFPPSSSFNFIPDFLEGLETSPALASNPLGTAPSLFSLALPGWGGSIPSPVALTGAAEPPAPAQARLPLAPGVKVGVPTFSQDSVEVLPGLS